MNTRFTMPDDAARPGESPDQRELLRCVRGLRAELAKRTAEVGCMSPDEIHSLLWAWDQLVDLHVAASVHDDRIECVREKLARAAWSD